jgi:predicted nuclease of restriction endonuclease-like (RecB) superfamily
MKLDSLIGQIQITHSKMQLFAMRKINYALSIRNWIIGFYLVEYEQKGEDHAKYGERLYRTIADELKSRNIKGMSFTMLHTCKQFYQCYPQIVQSPTEQLQPSDVLLDTIVQLPTEQSSEVWQVIIAKPKNTKGTLSFSESNPEQFLNCLTFTHIVELLKSDNELQRSFYEVQTIKNNWSVRELQRAMNSMLYERTGLSNNKEDVIAKIKGELPITPAEVIKNPFILEFLDIEEKAEYSENDLEQAIINHLQKFLIEMGRGFCFEARQKRITINNRHFKIDLVFYHRILKCHVLIDLKLGEFDHSDAGQMNLYLNYYSENELTSGDNPPVGIILCTYKDSSLVRYATGGLSQEIFVSKYLLQLPSEEELRKIIESDVVNFENNQE